MIDIRPHVPLEAYLGDDPFVFISYAHRDSDAVYTEIERLHKKGVRIWYDEGIEPGKDWASRVGAALSTCSLFLVFVSPNAVSSQNVQDEIYSALDERKPFLAIHLVATDLTEYPGLRLRMRRIQAILKYGMPQERYARQLDRALSPFPVVSEEELQRQAIIEADRLVSEACSSEDEVAAISLLEKAVSLVNDHKEAKSRLAEARSRLEERRQREMALQLVQYARAEDNLEQRAELYVRALEAYPGNQAARHELERTRAAIGEQQRREEAVELLEQAQHEQDLERRVELCRQALDVDETFEPVRGELTRAEESLAKQRRQDEARSLAAGLIEKAQRKTNLVQQIELFEQAVTADGSYDHARQCLEQAQKALQQQQRKAEALSLLNQAREEADLERQISLCEDALALDVTLDAAKSELERAENALKERRTREQIRLQVETLVEQARHTNVLQQKMDLYDQVLDLDPSCETAQRELAYVLLRLRQQRTQAQKLVEQGRAAEDVENRVALFEQALQADDTFEVAQDELTHARDDVEAQHSRRRAMELVEEARLQSDPGGQVALYERALQIYSSLEVAQVELGEARERVAAGKKHQDTEPLSEQPPRQSCVRPVIAFHKPAAAMHSSLPPIQQNLKGVTERVAAADAAVGSQQSHPSVIERFNGNAAAPVALPTDALTVEELCTFRGHTDPVNTVAFSPDSHSVVSGSTDKSVRLWTVKSGKSESLMTRITQVNAIAISADGGKLAYGGADNVVRLRPMRASNSTSLPGHTAKITALTFSGDGAALASASDDRTARLWDADTGGLLFTLDGGGKGLFSLAFSPDSRVVATGSWDGGIRLWEVASGCLVHELRQNNVCFALAFSPDGSQLVSSDGTEVALWNVATLQKIREFKGHKGVLTFVYSAAFSPDGTMIVSGAKDRTIRLWDVASGKLLTTLEGHTNWVRSVGFSPDGTMIVSGSDDKTVRIWKIVR